MPQPPLQEYTHSQLGTQDARHSLPCLDDSGRLSCLCTISGAIVLRSGRAYPPCARQATTLRGSLLGDWEIGRRWASSFSRVFWNPKDIPTQNAICDFRMEYKDISERVAFLAQEIRDLRQMNASYSKQSEGSQRTSRASHEERELRLRQIKEELSKLMLKPTREQ